MIEAAEIIENNAETILEEIGIDFRDDPEALDILKNVGCDVKGDIVHFLVLLVNYVKQPRLISHSMRAILAELLKLAAKYSLRPCIWTSICT